MTSFLDITGLEHFKDKMESKNDSTYVKSSSLDSIIDNKLINVYTYKGTVSSVDLLPKTNNKVGDVYDVAGGMNYAWNGTAWDALGENKIAVDSFLSDTSVNPVENQVIKKELDKKAGTSLASETSSGLMSAFDKKKLDNIQENANNYVPSDSPVGSKTIDLYKIATNEKGAVIDAVKVTKTDIVNLGIPSTDTKYSAISNTEIDNLFV